MKENINLENKEIVKNSKTLTNQEIVDFLYGDGNVLTDERFKDIDSGGVFKYFDPRDLTGLESLRSTKFFSLAKYGEKVVALAELEKNEKNLIIKFISVDPEYRNKGFASLVLKEIVDFSKKNNFDLESSSYFSKEGFEKIRPLLRRLADEEGVKLIDKEIKMFE